jgi:hypothetical protein
MKKQEWNTNYYSVYKEGEPLSAEHLDYGNFNRDSNYFISPMPAFWDDIIPIAEEKNVVLVSALWGEFIGHYVREGLFKYNKTDRYETIKSRVVPYRKSLSREYNTWNDILFPFTGYDVLDAIFDVPNDYYALTKTKKNQDREILRVYMLEEIFKDDIEIVTTCGYNWEMEEVRKNCIKNSWLSSKLYRDFNNIEVVKNAIPWEAPRTSLDAKLYGLATSYENTMRGN